MFGGADPFIANLVPSDITLRQNYISKPAELARAGMDGQEPDRAEERAARHDRRQPDRKQLGRRPDRLRHPADAAQSGRNGAVDRRAAGAVHEQHRPARGVGVQRARARQPERQPQPPTPSPSATICSSMSARRTGAAPARSCSPTAATASSWTTTLSSRTARRSSMRIPRLCSSDPHQQHRPRQHLGDHGQRHGSWQRTLARYYPGAHVHRNVFIGGNAATYPVDNFYPASAAAVGFVDVAGGNYRLTTASPYVNAATDGTAVGADQSAIVSLVPLAP